MVQEACLLPISTPFFLEGANRAQRWTTFQTNSAVSWWNRTQCLSVLPLNSGPFPQMERTCKHSELSAESWGLLATEEGQIVPIGTSGEETKQLHAISLRASWDTLKQGIKYILFLKNSLFFLYISVYIFLPSFFFFKKKALFKSVFLII